MSDEAADVSLARAFLAGGDSEPYYASTTHKLARSVLSLHDENTRLRAALGASVDNWHMAELRLRELLPTENLGELAVSDVNIARIAEMRREWKIG